MRVLGVSLDDVRDARRLDGLHAALRLEAQIEENPPKKDRSVRSIGDALLWGGVLMVIVTYVGAPLFLLAGGVWLPNEPPRPLGSILGWVMSGLALISLPVLGLPGLGKLDSFLALHGPARRALFLHRVAELVPRLLVGSIAWGGTMAGRLRFSELPFPAALLLSLAVALVPWGITALLVWKSIQSRDASGDRAVSLRGVLLMGGSAACITLILFLAFKIALEPASGSPSAQALLSRFAFLAPVLALAAGVILWRECLRSFERREVFGEGSHASDNPPRAETRPVPGSRGADLPFPSSRPRTMLGAQLRTLADSSWGVTKGLATVYGMFSVCIAMGFAWSMTGKGGINTWFLLPLALCLVPMGGMLHKERAWLLGMDLFVQRRHARAFVLAVQLPTFCLTGAVCAIVKGNDPGLWALVALMAGVIVFRLGSSGWDALARWSGWRSFPARIPVYLLAIALLFSPMAGPKWTLIAAGLGLAVGFLGIGLESHLVREKDLLDEMRRESESS